MTSARLRAHAETTAAAAERLRIGRDLHDSVSHALFVLRQRAEIIEKALETENAALLQAAAASLKDVSQQAITDMRALLAELRPAAAGTRDLVADLRRLAAEVGQRHGLEVDVDVDPLAPQRAASLDSRTCEHLERVAGEALHNAAKHAGAARATISLTVVAPRWGTRSGTGGSLPGTGGSELRLSVRDDGRGGAPTTGAGGGHGLRTMRERMTLCGGSLTVTSEPGAGTEVVAHLPLA
ncbi:sensor histidine kinase [Georgenia sp. SUBG003]|uniref:sensor histidine kinase n=1 Tax=Georgenia sp. SUBG003 TaxID=1497974 RepID=UPI003AB60761